eukprot:g28337.t1
MGIACCSMKEQLELLGAESAAALSGTLSAMSVGSQEPRLPPGGRFTVMMFGMTGSGKSALGNLLAGYDHFVSGDDTASVTNNQSVLKYEAPDRSLVLLDTIGLGDTELDQDTCWALCGTRLQERRLQPRQDKVVANIRDSALSAPNGVDAMVFVMRSGRITDDVIARLIYATEYLWGTECLLNLYIVVTYASRYVTQREEAAAWIERQCELNWRFRHIYSLVGNNENRTGRKTRKTQTHGFLKFQAKAAEASRKDMEAMEKEMAEAKERKRKAEEAYKQEMKNIQEDEEFRRMAAQAVEEADQSPTDESKSSNPIAACKRVFRALRRRFVKPKIGQLGGTPGTPSLQSPSPAAKSAMPVLQQRLTPEEVEAMVEEAHLLLVGSESQTSQQLFDSLDQQGLKYLSPVQFQLWVKKVCPDTNSAQVAGIWRRADQNCDGRISEEERYACNLPNLTCEMERYAQRTERALPELIRKSRLQELLKERETVHQDDLIDMLEPLYASHSSKGPDVMTLDQSAEGAREADTSLETVKEPSAAAQGLAGPPASLKLLRGDIEAFVVTQRHNRDHEDFDNDGYLSLSDLRSACEKFKIPNSSADLHALFSLLDKNDQGAVDIGEFTRNYQVHQGSLLDSMMRPIKSVKHEGGIEYGGPVQEKIDTQMRELEERHHSQALRSSSAPPNSGDDVASEAASRQHSAVLPRSNRSQISRTGASIASSGAPIYEPQVNQLTGKARISDVIRARFNAWKPDKPEPEYLKLKGLAAA